MRRVRRTTALLLTTAALLAGCQPAAPDTPAATVQPPPTPTADPATPSPSPTPTTAASYEVPEVIDAAYLERVLQALYDVEGDAGRIIVDEGAVTEEAVEILAAVYDAPRLAERINIYEEQVAAGFSDTRKPPGDLRVEVAEVISADPGCAFFSGLRDYRDVVLEPRPREGERDFFQLLPIEDGQDPNGRNPTPWVIGGSVIRADGSQPENPCAA